MDKRIPAVILCGGRGTRMGCDELPKPMFDIGGKPILWHIMKSYAHFGCRDFILLLGYKKEKIREYFCGHRGWNIEFLDTGLETNTGARIRKAQKLLNAEDFFVTYGDGLSDVDLGKLLTFHYRHAKSVTLTSVRPLSQFGIMGIDSHSDTVTHFEEKPILDHWVNGGFFVFNRTALNYIRDNDVLESDSFSRLVQDKQLAAYKHYGFWRCMDTYKDNLNLNQLWNSGKAPWANPPKRKNSR